jgi:hypothetical protein
MARTITATRKNGEKGLRDGYQDITTRAEAELLARLKHLAIQYGGSLTDVYAALLKQFFVEEPWVNHNIWRKTKGLTETVKTKAETKTPDNKRLEVFVSQKRATGWVQVNLRVETALAKRVKQLAAAYGESPSTVLYTALCWWVFVKNYNKQ